tara:strand:+ start:36 stop:338 length:303 start_codon:yes stop_codon:yes gene_type:complete
MAEQEKTEKVTTEELGHLQTLSQNFNSTKIAIANAAIALNKATSDQQTEIDKLAVIQTEFADVEKELMKNYGENANINLQTGEVTHPEVKPEVKAEVAEK